MLKGMNMNQYLYLQCFFGMFLNYFLPQAEQSVILLTRERCHAVNIIFGHLTYSIKVKKPSEPAGTFQICFWYFILFNIKRFFPKIFNIDQTDVTSDMKVFTRH